MTTTATGLTPWATRPRELHVGDRVPTETIGPLTRSDFVRYAGAGGDMNPMHHDETIAVAAGMPSVFGMGLLHAGIVGARVTRWAGPDAIRSFAVRFTGQVWPGDVLAMTGVVSGVELGRANVDLRVERDGGECVLVVRASIDVQDRASSSTGDHR